MKKLLIVLFTCFIMTSHHSHCAKPPYQPPQIRSFFPKPLPVLNPIDREIVQNFYSTFFARFQQFESYKDYYLFLPGFIRKTLLKHGLGPLKTMALNVILELYKENCKLFSQQRDIPEHLKPKYALNATFAAIKMMFAQSAETSSTCYDAFVACHHSRRGCDQKLRQCFQQFDEEFLDGDDDEKEEVL